MKKGLAEIVNEVKKAKSVGQKVKILQDNQLKELLGLFELAYDNRLKWQLPEGNPPYQPLAKSMDAQGHLYVEMKRMYIFLEGLNKVHQAKREQIFVRMLEEIDPDDAQLLLEVKARKIKGVSKKVVKQAFPGFLDEPENQDA